VPRPIEPRPYVMRRQLLVKSAPASERVLVRPVRERFVPRAELAERLWLTWAECLNADDEEPRNTLTTHPAEFARLFERVRDSLHRFQPIDTAAVQAHARRWRLRTQDLGASLRLADIQVSVESFPATPRLRMPVVVYRGGLRHDLVRVGPQHQDPVELIRLARRRLRRLKGWRLADIADADRVSDWKVVQASLRTWWVIDQQAEP